MKKSIILLVMVLSLMVVPQAFAAQDQPVTINNQDDGMAPTENIIYVNDDAAGSEDGSSWANAYTKLQDALAVAESGDQVWVAKGVYYPDEYLVSNAPALDDPRDATFQLESGVAIYGGFAGIESETLLDDRAWESNVTVLSGDIDYDNDDESEGKDNNKDANGVISSPDDIQGNNAYHVVTGSGTDNTAILDGFTINAGQAIGDDLSIPNGGGGIYNDMGSPFLENLTIRANSATDGMVIVIIRNRREEHVVAAHGGGIFNDNSSSPTLEDVTITYNSATGNGGGISNDNSSDPTLEGVTVTHNSATGNGGGISNDNSSNPRLEHVTVTHNFATGNGGGIVNNNSSNPTLEGVTITHNQGTGISNFSSSPTFKDVTITHNQGTGISNGSSSPMLEDVTIAHNQGGGISNVSSNPTLEGVTITHNQGTGISNFESSPTLKSVTITNNSTTGDGGGILNWGGQPTLEDVTITHNSATNGRGGGMSNFWRSRPTLIRTEISSNEAKLGGGIFNSSHFLIELCPPYYEPDPTGCLWTNASDIKLEEVTITNNSASENGGGIHNEYLSSVTLKNGTIANNEAGLGGGIYSSSNSRIVLENVTVRDNSATNGGGMYNNDSLWDTFKDVVIKDNSVSENGGGIYNNDVKSLTLTGVTIENNSATKDGGGVYNANSNPTLTEMTIKGNSASENGGGVYNATSNPTLTGVTIENNSADNNGGGIYNANSNPTLERVTMTTNSADNNGGGIYNDSSNPSLTEMTIENNSADNNGGGVYNSQSSPALTEMTIKDNSADNDGGGVYNSQSSPTLTEVTIENNSATKDGGGIYNATSSPTLTEMTIKGNSASENGGGIYNATSHPTLDWVIIENNSATKDGGGVYNNNSSSPILTNALINNNRAGQHGGGVSNSDSQPTLINVTLNANAADGLGGGIYNASSSETTLTNVIMWNNTADGAPGSMSDSIDHVDGTLRIKNSLIEGYGASGQNWQGPEGSDLHGNIDEDPLFKTDDDLSLQFNSPAVDAGDSSANNEPVDLAGQTRVQGGAIDMGAYETEPVPDIEVQGQGIEISSGDNEPSTSDNTDFGAIVLNGVMPKTFTIHNKGHVDLALNGVSPVSVSPNDTFKVTQQPQTGLAHGESSEFVIEFTPSTTGVHRATVSIESNDPDEDPYTFMIQGQGSGPDIEVQGQGIEISNGDNEPSTSDNTDFGDAVIASDVIPKTFTIHNKGDMDLTLNELSPVSLSTSGTFTVSQPSDTTIPSGQSSTFVIDFAPSTTEQHQALVMIESNDPDEASYTFMIQGTGIEPGTPEIEVQGESNEIEDGDEQPRVEDGTDFGDVSLDSPPYEHTFMIHNKGDVPLTLDELSVAPLSGDSESSSFSIDAEQLPATTISAGESSQLVVLFAPDAMGLHQARVTIENNDSDEGSYNFVIQGMGADNDGVESSIEDEVPNANGEGTGDGNGDGTPDREQEHVVSLPASTEHYVTFATDENKKLVNVRPEEEPIDAPTEMQFPYGHFSFEVTGLETGGEKGEEIQVSLTIHDDQNTPTTFWKYGPTPDNQTDHWYEFSYDEQTKTGAVIDGQTITLYFVDGQRGDSDLTINGKIVDPGAPAMASSNTVNEPPASTPIATPEPSASPVSSATPEPSASPVSSATPEPSASPVSSATPEPSASPVSSATPEPNASPTPEPNVTPTPTPPPTNYPPELDRTIPDITVTEGAAAQSFNPFDYFSDPEDDLLYFNILANSSRDVAPSFKVGLRFDDEIMIEFGKPGVTTITIEAEEDVHHKKYQGHFTITVLPAPTPNLSMSQTVSNHEVMAGEEITYTLTISNSGDGMASNLRISDTLPAGVTFMSNSIRATGHSAGRLGSQPPLLAQGITIKPKEMMTLTLSAKVNEDLLVGHMISNTMQLTASELISPMLASSITTVMSATLDLDEDGVSSEIENQVPNLNGDGTGDGNGDGIADYKQDHVTSLLNSNSGEYVTFVVAEELGLTNVQLINNPARDSLPDGVDLIQTLFDFTITGAEVGQSASVSLISHAQNNESLPNSYWKYGPTPDEPTPHWYLFTFDEKTRTGAQIDGNTITLHFVDGARGDDDLTTNGQIRDPGAPALYQAPTAVTLTQLDAQSASNWQLLLGGLMLMTLLSLSAGILRLRWCSGGAAEKTD